MAFPSNLQQSQDSGSESQLNTSSLKEALERFNHSRTPSASSRSSRKSSHTAVSDPACKHPQQAVHFKTMWHPDEKRSVMSVFHSQHHRWSFRVTGVRQVGSLSLLWRWHLNEGHLSAVRSVERKKKQSLVYKDLRYGEIQLYSFSSSFFVLCPF